jgi:hypothetical protein
MAKSQIGVNSTGLTLLSFAAKFYWKLRPAEYLIRREIANRLDDAGKVALRQLRKNLSTPFPPASMPGEFPHRRTGELQRRTRYTVNRSKLTLSLYADAKHAPFVEKTRPFLTRSLFMAAGQIMGCFGRRRR